MTIILSLLAGAVLRDMYAWMFEPSLADSVKAAFDAA